MAKYKVCLVEDDPDVGAVVEMILKDYDCEITNIRDVNSFRMLADKVMPDLIILDLMLPGINGFEICQYFRNRAETADTPILAFTGYDSVDNQKKIMAAGATDYSPKPFDIKSFKFKVKKLLKISDPLE
ncbi:MAG: response regulator [Elusimicrobiota bacterium]